MAQATFEPAEGETVLWTGSARTGALLNVRKRLMSPIWLVVGGGIVALEARKFMLGLPNNLVSESERQVLLSVLFLLLALVVATSIVEASRTPRRLRNTVFFITDQRIGWSEFGVPQFLRWNQVRMVRCSWLGPWAGIHIYTHVPTEGFLRWFDSGPWHTLVGLPQARAAHKIAQEQWSKTRRIALEPGAAST